MPSLRRYRDTDSPSPTFDEPKLDLPIGDKASKSHLGLRKGLFLLAFAGSLLVLVSSLHRANENRTMLNRLEMYAVDVIDRTNKVRDTFMLTRLSSLIELRHGAMEPSQLNSSKLYTTRHLILTHLRLIPRLRKRRSRHIRV